MKGWDQHRRASALAPRRGGESRWASSPCQRPEGKLGRPSTCPSPPSWTTFTGPLQRIPDFQLTAPLIAPRAPICNRCRAREACLCLLVAAPTPGAQDDRRLSRLARPAGLAVVIGLYRGLRRFEIAKLRWADFDSEWLRLVGKGNVEAQLPVHPRRAALPRPQTQRHPVRVLRTRRRVSPPDDGLDVGAPGLDRGWSRRGADPSASAHRACHGMASGVPVKVASELMGHASPTITLAVCAHVSPGMAEEVGAALSASLPG